jgi:hypothetical protein
MRIIFAPFCSAMNPATTATDYGTKHADAKMEHIDAARQAIGELDRESVWTIICRDEDQWPHH